MQLLHIIFPIGRAKTYSVECWFRKSFWQFSTTQGDLTIDKVQQEILTPDDRSFRLLEKIVAYIGIQVCSTEYLSPIVVADITVDGMLVWFYEWTHMYVRYT